VSTLTINVSDGEAFSTYDEVLQHIYRRHYAEGIVKASWLAAMREREAEYPTGIELEGYAIAIPHCGSEHASLPAVYVIRLPEPVQVNQADGDGKLWVRLVINLIVTDPADQLHLLKSMFNHMQNKDFYNDLLELSAEDAKALFISTII
jgi:PTS system galactitol-specific IIA component